MSEVKIPKTILEKIRNVNERTGIDIEELKKDYIERFSSDFIQTDEQFTSDEQRHKHVIMTLWRNYIARPPAKEFIVIPIGYDGAKKTQSSGQLRSVIYAMVKGETGIQQISCLGTSSEKYKNLNLFLQYTVKMGQYKNGDFAADDRAKFMNPRRISLSTEDLLSRLEIVQTTIKKAAENKSHVRSDGYTDKKDWRCIRGLISRKWSRTNEDGTELGVYTISDDSIWFDDPQVAPDGTTMSPGFTVWIHPSHMVYETEDQCDFYGSITIDREKQEAQMNCYLALPVIVRGKKVQTEE